MADPISKNLSNVSSFYSNAGLGVKPLTELGALPVTDKWASFNYSGFAVSSEDDPINQAFSTNQGGSFNFITAPQQVSWDVNTKVDRVAIFGTNEPPVVVGSTDMKNLSLADAMMEGFVVKKSMEEPIQQLTNLIKVSLDTKGGFVSVPVYTVSAGGKSYGNYVIESVKVSEEVRDLQGRATRVKVDVDFKEVPSYQINTGRDQANDPGLSQSMTQPGSPTNVNQASSQASKVATANASKAVAAPGTAGSGVGAALGSGGGSQVANRDPRSQSNIKF